VGPQVSVLHTKLADQGFDIPATEVKARVFGPGTRTAVRSLQRERRLPASGVVDDTVWTVLEVTATSKGTARESTAAGLATSGPMSDVAAGRSGRQVSSTLVFPATGHVFPPIELGPSVSVDLVRADDLLSLRVAGYNLQLDPAAQAGDPQLVRVDPSADAYLAYLFPPQSIAEQAFYESKAGFSDSGTILGPPGPPPVPSRMSGLSRLVFLVSPAAGAVPFTFAGLLDWSQMSLVVAAVAAGATPGELPRIQPPSALETAIEMPRRLFISPDPDAPWLHATLPVTHGGRTELWHTRLARSDNTGDGNAPAEIDLANPGHIRAIWSPDYSPGHPAPEDALDPGFPVLTALSPRDRHQIVASSASYTDYTVRATWFLHAFAGARTPRPGQERQVNYSPVAVPVDRLMLSSLGGWLQAHGQWSIDLANLPTSVTGGRSDQLTLSEWVHQATQGRDHYVRIVKEGCLYPFGHRAALVKVTERKFQSSGDGSGDPVAYLRQHMYVIVREPEKSYAGAAFANGGREMPFSASVRLTTRVTPDIDYPYSPPCSITTASFWVMVGGVPFPFHVSALDADGQQIEFTAGLVFVDGNEQDMLAIQSAYSSRDDLRVCSAPGGSIAYAPPSAPGAGDTTLTTDALYFDTQASDTLPCQFLPYLFKADVHIPSLEQLLGTNAASTIKLYDGYLANGLDPHAAVFAQLANGIGASLSDITLPVSFSADKAGGFATPNLGVSSISRALGPLAGDPANAVQDTFNPGDFFPAGTASLFGVFDLAQLIPAGTTYDNAPKIKITPQPANAPTEIVTTIDWTPAIQPVHVGPLTLTPQATRPQLQVHGMITKPVTGSQAGAFLFTGELTDIRLDFAGVIALTFDRFRFVAQTGRKLDLTVEIAASNGIQFEGDLAFVEQLQNVIPPGVFSDGPSLDVTPTQAVLSYAIGLPPLTVAVFSLEQVSLSAGLTLPFLDGTPLFDFGFAERHHPFLLTIGFLGGGGFFHLQVGADGIKQVEAALEFGGNFALDLGVASGSVHIMAGIYFAMQTNAGTTAVTLSGYLRMGGEVSVLDLISVSVEFYLSFTYDTGTGKATGQATLTVAVQVAFFSASVDLTVQRSFGSQGGDPTFGQLMDADAWQQYAAAFA
jgi:peptidoglycan hydrolase-like protein with peptidoglycan-binding domain